MAGAQKAAPQVTKTAIPYPLQKGVLVGACNWARGFWWKALGVRRYPCKKAQRPGTQGESTSISEPNFAGER